MSSSPEESESERVPAALSRGVLDRATQRRGDDAWLAAAWAADSTRVVLVSRGTALVGPDSELVLVPPAAVPIAGSAGEPGAGPDVPAELGRPTGERYFLGVDADGIAYFAVAVPELPALPDRADARPAGLREVGALLGDRDAGVLVHAVALEQWHRRHPRCARCGEATVIGDAGHLRRCPGCAAEHFPRTDPAVIMRVTDDADRCLLGRQAAWPPGRYSVLAGFVDPGESLEQAVAREVAEEVGLQVHDIRYVTSQPWPFPSSLMLAFSARTEDAALRPDGEEIADARWYSRDELRAAIDSGELLVPSTVSVARRLVEDWYGGPLPGQDRW